MELKIQTTQLLKDVEDDDNPEDPEKIDQDDKDGEDVNEGSVDLLLDRIERDCFIWVLVISETP